MTRWTSKDCHGYLLAELASAYNRPGEYGGSFENRFRLLKKRHPRRQGVRG